MQPVIVPSRRFYDEDCVAAAKKHHSAGSVVLIITDPPYGINGDEFHPHYNLDEEFVVEGYVDVRASEDGEFSLNWIREAERILKPGGSIYIVSGYTNLHHIQRALRQTELEEIHQIIWKYNIGVYTIKKYVSSDYQIL